MIEQAEANIHLNFHAALRACLTDGDPHIRLLAVEGLWEDERVSLVRPLIDLLAHDPAAEVRAAAATSLGRFVLLGVLGDIAEEPAREAEDALAAAWQRAGEPVAVRRRALEGLSYTDTPDVHRLIGNAYYDDDALMRQSAVFAMGRSADPRWNKIVLSELNGRDAAMRFEAAEAAGEMALRAAVQPLIRRLDDPDRDVREAAALALGKIGGPTARRVLENLLEGEDERLAEAAEEALEELNFSSNALDDVLLDYSDSPARHSRAAQVCGRAISSTLRMKTTSRMPTIWTGRRAGRFQRRRRLGRRGGRWRRIGTMRRGRVARRPSWGSRQVLAVVPAASLRSCCCGPC